MDLQSCLEVSPHVRDGVVILTVTGLLDDATEMTMRSAIVAAATDGPRALIVDVSGLTVSSSSSWAVFTSSHCQGSVWRAVPMALLCKHQSGQDEIRRTGLPRYLPLYTSLSEALAGVRGCGNPMRRRASVELPTLPGSVDRAGRLVADWLTQWCETEFIAAATTVATVFLEDVIAHACGATALLRLESTGSSITMAVDDANPAPAELAVASEALPGSAGLEIVRALTLAWGNAPTESGKSVWAVIGPPSRIHH